MPTRVAETAVPWRSRSWRLRCAHEVMRLGGALGTRVGARGAFSARPRARSASPGFAARMRRLIDAMAGDGRNGGGVERVVRMARERTGGGGREAKRGAVAPR